VGHIQWRSHVHHWGCRETKKEKIKNSPTCCTPKKEKRKKNKIFLPMDLPTFFFAINDKKINLFLLFFVLFSL
jgi:hypothetical protein